MTEQRPQESMVIQTTRFGEITVPAEKVVTMPHGMVGFPQYHRYLPIQHKEGSPFYWLQCLEAPDLAFVMVTPIHFEPGYQVSLGQTETKLLELEDIKDIQVWAVVTIPHGQPDKMTANLKAPVVINMANRMGVQMILDDPRYSLRHRLSQETSGEEGPGK